MTLCLFKTKGHLKHAIAFGSCFLYLGVNWPTMSCCPELAEECRAIILPPGRSPCFAGLVHLNIFQININQPSQHQGLFCRPRRNRLDGAYTRAFPGSTSSRQSINEVVPHPVSKRDPTFQHTLLSQVCRCSDNPHSAPVVSSGLQKLANFMPEVSMLTSREEVPKLVETPREVASIRLDQDWSFGVFQGIPACSQACPCCCC